MIQDRLGGQAAQRPAYDDSAQAARQRRNGEQKSGHLTWRKYEG